MFSGKSFDKLHEVFEIVGNGISNLTQLFGMNLSYHFFVNTSFPH